MCEANTNIITRLFHMNFPGLPSVVTLSLPMTLNMHDGIPVDEACRRLEEAGADVVGLNCGRGPGTMVEPLKIIRKACKVKYTMLLLVIFNTLCLSL